MQLTKKFILYLRKSTDRDDMQTLSIPGQEEACIAYAQQHNLLIVDRIIEHVSAKAPGRPLFNKMMQDIAAGKANAILAYHPNRLARNSKDGGEIVYWLDTGQLVDLKFPVFWFENTGQGKYMLNLEFAQSKRYTDDLAMVSKRGLLQKCNAGHFPGRAPLGYRNDRSRKILIEDPETSGLVRKMFELYAEGTCTMDDIRRYLAKQNISASSTKPSKALSMDRKSMAKLLKNPFYYGAFRYAGQLYQGKHQPLISKRLYDRVQQVINTRWRPKANKSPGLYTKLLRCGRCRMSITADFQRGRTYYRCTRKSREVDCKEPFIREEDLVKQLERLLLQFNLDHETATNFLNRINQEESTALDIAKTAVQEKQVELDLLQHKQDRLLESYLDRTISHEQYTRKQREMFGNQQTILQTINEIEKNPNGWLDAFRKWVNTAQNMVIIAKSDSPFERKLALAKIFGSTLYLAGRKVSGKAVKPWFFLAKSGESQTKVHLFDQARTFFQENGQLPGNSCFVLSLR